MEVVLYFPPFVLTAIVAIAVFAIATNKLGMNWPEASFLGVFASSIVGALSYIVLVALLGCPPCG